MFELAHFLLRVIEKLKTKFPDTYIKAYPIYRIETTEFEIRDPAMPAIFVDLFEIVPASPTSECYSTASLTGRLGLTLMMTAYIVVGRSMPRANLKIREYAMEVAAAINAFRRFDIAYLSPAQIVSVTNQTEIEANNQSYLAWAVAWSHDVIVGAPQDKEICPDPPVDAETVKKVYADIDVYGDTSDIPQLIYEKPGG